MKQVYEYLKLVRWPNLLIIGIVLWVLEKWTVVPILGDWGEPLDAWMLALLIAAEILIAAGGFVINDYFDVKIDRINRPENLIITNSVSKTQAMWLFRILTGLGVVCGLMLAWLCCHSMSLTLLMLMVPGLLWFYSSSYKRMMVVGNLIIALMTAFIPISVALANVGLMKYQYGDILGYTTLVHDIYAWLGGIALVAFLCAWIREMVKNMQNQTGDRELECHTLPIMLGDRWTKIIITVIIAITIGVLIWLGLTAVPFPHGFRTLAGRYIILGLIIPLLGETWLIWAAKIPSDYRSAQQLMKFVLCMVALYSIVIFRNLQ